MFSAMMEEKISRMQLQQMENRLKKLEEEEKRAQQVIENNKRRCRELDNQRRVKANERDEKNQWKQDQMSNLMMKRRQILAERARLQNSIR